MPNDEHEVPPSSYQRARPAGNYERGLVKPIRTRGVEIDSGKAVGESESHTGRKIDVHPTPVAYDCDIDIRAKKQYTYILQFLPHPVRVKSG